jgi:hypothetical protein
MSLLLGNKSNELSAKGVKNESYDNFTGSSVIKSTLRFIDNVSCKSSAMDSICACPQYVRDIRLSFLDLLKEEMNAIKWWGESSYFYIMNLANDIDARVRDVGFLGSAVQTAADQDNSRKAMESLKSVLFEATTRLQEALYSIPDVAGAIPNAFILADPDALLKKDSSQFKLEEDGFEII